MRILAVRLVLLAEVSLPVLSVNCDFFDWNSTEPEIRNPCKNQSHNSLPQNTCRIENDVSNNYPLVACVTVSPSRCAATVRERTCRYTFWREGLWSVPCWAAKYSKSWGGGVTGIETEAHKAQLNVKSLCLFFTTWKAGNWKTWLRSHQDRLPLSSKDICS